MRFACRAVMMPLAPRRAILTLALDCVVRNPDANYVLFRFAAPATLACRFANLEMQTLWTEPIWLLQLFCRIHIVAGEKELRFRSKIEKCPVKRVEIRVDALRGIRDRARPSGQSALPAMHNGEAPAQLLGLQV
jgi:hypothetical protein